MPPDFDLPFLIRALLFTGSLALSVSVISTGRALIAVPTPTFERNLGLLTLSLHALLATHLLLLSLL